MHLKRKVFKIDKALLHIIATSRLVNISEAPPGVKNLGQ